MNAVVPHLFQEELYQFAAPVTVVLPRGWDSYPSDEQMLLRKILTSVKVDMNAVQLLVRPSVELKVLRVYGATRILVFGCETGEDIPLYQQTTAQGLIVIRADDLNVLDEQKKKNLWIALRQMFGI